MAPAPPARSRSTRWLFRLGWALTITGAIVLVFAGSFYLTMHLVFGGREVQVPDLAGLPLEEARAALTRSNLYLEAASESHDDRVPKGHVRSQDPPAGATIKTNRKVRVGISLGPALTKVPDLRRQTLRAARIALQKAGTPLGDVTRTHDPYAPVDVVIAQDPPPDSAEAEPAGQVVRAWDGRVDLLVSLGPVEPRYVMPDLTRHDIEAVRAFARRAGLRLGAVRRERSPDVPRGTVIRQYPQAGHPVKRQEIVSLVLSD